MTYSHTLRVGMAYRRRTQRDHTNDKLSQLSDHCSKRNKNQKTQINMIVNTRFVDLRAKIKQKTKQNETKHHSLRRLRRCQIKKMNIYFPLKRGLHKVKELKCEFRSHWNDRSFPLCFASKYDQLNNEITAQ